MRRRVLLLTCIVLTLSILACGGTGDFAGRTDSGTYTCPAGTRLGDDGAGRPVCWR